MSYMYLIILKKRHAYKSKYDKEGENQVTVLMITDGEKWLYLVVKKMPALLRWVKSKHDGDFYFLNCFHSNSAKDIAIIAIIILKKSSAIKINEHTPSTYSLFTHCSFDLTKNKLDCYRGKDCMKMFCKDLKEHATKIINCEKKEMTPLTDEENKSYKKQKVCFICKKGFSTDDDNKNYHKVRDHCHYTGKYSRAVVFVI